MRRKKRKKSRSGLWITLFLLTAAAVFLLHIAERNSVVPAESAASSASPVQPVQYQIPDSEHGFYYEQLSDLSKQAYDAVYEGCFSLQSEIDIPDVSEQDFLRAEAAVRAEHPEFFWLSSSDGTYVSDPSNGIVKQLNMNLDGSEQSVLEKIESEADDVIDSIPAAASAYEKAKAIYDWIIDNTDYGTGSTNGGQDIRSVFLDHQSVCAGYAKSFQYLAEKAGLSCIYVTGTAESAGVTASHAWNLLQIDGTWYWVDVTWGDPVFDAEQGESSKNYDFFCVDDAVIFRSHTLNETLEEHVEEPFAYPACSDNRLDWYVQHGSSFEQYDQSTVLAYVDSCLSNGQDDDIEMRFGSMEALNEAVQDLIDDQNIKNASMLQNAGSFQVTYGKNEDSCVLRLSFALNGD